MDPTSGLNMTVVGVTTVFVALSMLVASVAALARILSRPTADAGAEEASAATATAPSDAVAGTAPQLRAVAVAAFTFHHHVTRRRRFAEVVIAAAGTPWLQAARAEQAGALPTRG